MSGLRKFMLSRGPPGVGIQREQRSVVVEHFLEMRNRPFGVHAVAAEASGQLIVDATFGHACERHDDDLECVFVAAKRVATQAQLQIGRVWEFRRGAKPAPGGIERADKQRERALRRIGREIRASFRRLRIRER